MKHLFFYRPLAMEKVHILGKIFYRNLAIATRFENLPGRFCPDLSILYS